MESASGQESSTLNWPSTFTEEELFLKSKYAELKRAKERLQLHHQNTICKPPEKITIKSNAAKISCIRQSEINLKRTSDFKKPSKQHQQSAVQRPIPKYSLEDDTEPRSINVKGNNLSDEYLQTHFSQFGYIWKVRTNESKSSAVLTFKQPSSAKRAVAELDGRIVDGIELTVSLPRRRNISWCNTEDSLNKLLDIKNRGRSVHLFFKGCLMVGDIEEFFQSVGRVTRIYLNVRKRFGFVTFENEEQAQRAIKELNGDFCKGVKIVVSPQKCLCTDATTDCKSETGQREMIAYEDIDI